MAAPFGRNSLDKLAQTEIDEGRDLGGRPRLVEKFDRRPHMIECFRQRLRALRQWPIFHTRPVTIPVVFYCSWTSLSECGPPHHRPPGCCPEIGRRRFHVRIGLCGHFPDQHADALHRIAISFEFDDSQKRQISLLVALDDHAAS